MKSRLLAAAEALLVFGACQLYLWRYYREYRRGWLLILAFIIGSMVVRRESAEKLGLSFRHAAAGAARWTAIATGAAAIPLMLYGYYTGRLDVMLPDAHALLQFTAYFVWCLLQQFALQSYIHNRVRDAAPGWRGISLVVGVMFGSLHLPNPVLTIATFVGGIATAGIFARYRNIWILALGQALASTLIFVALPDTWHHRLRVGPGYYFWPGRI